MWRKKQRRPTAATKDGSYRHHAARTSASPARDCAHPPAGAGPALSPGPAGTCSRAAAVPKVCRQPAQVGRALRPPETAEVPPPRRGGRRAFSRRSPGDRTPAPAAQGRGLGRPRAARPATVSPALHSGLGFRATAQPLLPAARTFYSRAGWKPLLRGSQAFPGRGPG